jgi:filamin
MITAQKELSIPLVVTPENMSSPELDELSSITYLSYFMKEDSPGYESTLRLVQNILDDEKVTNFTVSLLFIQ